MSEQLLREAPLTRESFELAELKEVHEKMVTLIVATLHERHQDKLFHGPEHTLGNPSSEGLSGVARVAEQLARQLADTMPQSLMLANRSSKEEFEVFVLAVKEGMLTHDIEMEIDGITEEGTVIRRRGFEPGKNEFESACFRSENSTLPRDNPYYDRFEAVATRTVKGTDPDVYFATLSGEVLPIEVVLSDRVRSYLTVADGTLGYLNIEPQTIPESLEELLGSTADLSAAVVPERFFVTGNEEFFELNYAISKDCAAFLNNPRALSRARMATILEKMKVWRKLQIGVAFGQWVRLCNNFTVENITQLFERSFGYLPEALETEAYTTSVKNMGVGMKASMEQSVDYYEQFLAFTIEPEGSSELTIPEIQDFDKALKAMRVSGDRLEAYVVGVEEALKKLTETSA